MYPIQPMSLKPPTIKLKSILTKLPTAVLSETIRPWQLFVKYCGKKTIILAKIMVLGAPS